MNGDFNTKAYIYRQKATRDTLFLYCKTDVLHINESITLTVTACAKCPKNTCYI